MDALNTISPVASAAEDPREREESNLLELLILLAENRRLIIVIPLLAGLLTLAATFWMKPVYTASARILPPGQQQGMSNALLANLGSIAGLTGGAGIKNPADQFVAYLKSRVIADRIIARFDLRTEYQQKLNENTRQVLEKRTLISSGKDGLITINVDDHSPERARDLATAYVEELQRRMAELAVSEAAQRRSFFENQLSKARAQLASAEIELKATGIAESALKANPASAVDIVARLRAQVTAQELRLASLKNFATDANPDVVRANAELQALRSQLEQIEHSGGKTKDGADPNYIERYRNYKYAESLYEILTKQFEAARLDELREGPVLQVIDPAVVPELKSKPRRSIMVLLAVLVGVFGTVAFVIARHAVRNAVSDRGIASQLQRLRGTLGLKQK